MVEGDKYYSATLQQPIGTGTRTRSMCSKVIVSHFAIVTVVSSCLSCMLSERIRFQHVSFASLGRVRQFGFMFFQIISIEQASQSNHLSRARNINLIFIERLGVH
jgi:hypothetical protein